MIGELLVVVYILLAVVLGIGVFTKTLSWLAETDRVVFPPSRVSILGWGLVAFVSALFLEFSIIYPFWGSSAMLLLLAIAVGPIEEGSKLLPYLLIKNGDEMSRWYITLRASLVFGLMEAALYFLVLLSRGNLIGGLLRAIVAMYHVAWTAIALEDALKGSLLRGYLRASLLHGLYDAPVLLLYFSGSFAGLLALGGMWAVVYLYRSLDEAFGFAVRYRTKLLERRTNAEGMGGSWESNEGEKTGEGFSSWP